MRFPTISIILPVYNAAPFLKSAISSVIEQTFTDFELIIINDGSTDDTNEIIASFKDDRIICMENIENKGLIYTLNRGINLAKGKYIARMDADDICTSNRLYLQKSILDNDPTIAVVAGWIDFIDSNNNKQGDWELDRKTNTTLTIKKALLKQNCIAHPTVMGRVEIFKKYEYQANQKNIEDYDLWLRLISDGYKIEKVQEVILYYRIHDNSITHTTLKKGNFFFKHFNCKMKFLYTQIKNCKINFYLIKIFFFMIMDALMGIGKEVKKVLTYKNV